MNKIENLLTTVTEECAEVQQATSKALRFGLNTHNPLEPSHTNSRDIIYEYHQLQAIIELLQQMDVLPVFPEDTVNTIKRKKLAAIEKYQNVSIENGCLNVLPKIPAQIVKDTRDRILRHMNEFSDEWKQISQSSVDHFGGKIDAMETAKRIVNNALTDLLPQETPETSEPVINSKRAMELLNSIVDHTAAAENTPKQIQNLIAMGFDPEELVAYFHYSQNDVDNALAENPDDI